MLNAQSSHDESINVNEDHKDPYNTFRRTNLSPSIPYECIIEFDYIGLDLGLGFHPGVKSFLEFVPVWFSVRLAEAVRTSLAFKVAVDGYTALSRPDRIPCNSYSNERWARLSIGTRHSVRLALCERFCLLLLPTAFTTSHAAKTHIADLCYVKQCRNLQRTSFLCRHFPLFNNALLCVLLQNNSMNWNMFRCRKVACNVSHYH